MKGFNFSGKQFKMFGRYDVKSNSMEDNETENWSFPYERFSTINVPKSRLGKRRTINSTDVKRDVLGGLPSESNNVSKEEKDGTSTFSQGPSLTHPINSNLTPNHKRVNPFENYMTQNKWSQESKKASHGKLGGRTGTPFRKDNSLPLKEIKNFLNDPRFTPGPTKPSPHSQPLQADGDSDFSSNIQRVLNKSFEAEGLNEVVNEEKICQTEKTGATSEPQGDSSNSDLCNNSSFMTAHDVYNIDRSRLHQDSMHYKTPHKGFTLFDKLESPAAPDSDPLKILLTKTPGLNKFEPYKTPFRSQSKVDPYSNALFTPTLLNIPKTPMVRSQVLSMNSPVPLVEEIKSGQDLDSAKKIDSTCLPKTSPPSEENITLSESQKPSPSFVKRQIFEGLGWSLPRSSFSIKSPSLDLHKNKDKGYSHSESSVLLTPNNSSSESSHSTTNSCVNSSEMGADYGSNFTASHDPKDKFSLSTGGENTSSIQTIASSLIFDQHNIPSNVTEPAASSVNKTVNYSLRNDTFNKHFEREMDFSVDKSSMGNSCLNSAKSSSFIDSNLSVDRLNLGSLNQNPTDGTINFNSTYQSSIDGTAIESTVQMRNDYAICQEETALVTAQNPMEGPPPDSEIKDVTVVARQPDEIKKPDPVVPVSKISQPQPAPETKQEPTFVVPQPVLPFPRQAPKPQTNIVYVKNKTYTVLSMLGRGGSSEVYQVLDAESSKLMAMKFVNLASVEESIATGYLNEIEVLSKLQGCSSVIKMFDSEYIPESKILYVVMEKGDTDFSRLMRDIMKTKKLSMSMITYYWTEMLSCVKDIHEKGIIHSDLKPANFLLVSGRLKLIDFGIASSLQGDMTSVLKDVTTGTFNYMSPEAIRNCGETRGYKITYKSDIWSLGCILYNLLYGRTPFSHLTNTWAKLGAIADPETGVSFPTEVSAPPHLLYSVRWALRKDPKERPTATELLKLAEITSFSDTQLGKQISSLLSEYICQTFPNCKVKLEVEKMDKKH